MARGVVDDDCAKGKEIAFNGYENSCSCWVDSRQGGGVYSVVWQEVPQPLSMFLFR